MRDTGTPTALEMLRGDIASEYRGFVHDSRLTKTLVAFEREQAEHRFEVRTLETYAKQLQDDISALNERDAKIRAELTALMAANNFFIMRSCCERAQTLLDGGRTDAV